MPLRIALLLPLIVSSACVMRAAPMGDASTIVVDPSWTLEERQEELEKREMHPSVIVHVTTHTSGNTASSSVHVDRSALEQDGRSYSAAAYLPVLQAEGIATDLEDPTPYMKRAAKAQMLWTMGGLIGMGVGMQVALSGSDTAMLTGIGIVGAAGLTGVVGAFAHPLAILQPVRKIHAKARRKRRKWADEFNAGLARKLGASDAAVPAPSDDGPMLVPAPTPAPATESRHK